MLALYIFFFLGGASSHALGPNERIAQVMETIKQGIEKRAEKEKYALVQHNDRLNGPKIKNTEWMDELLLSLPVEKQSKFAPNATTQVQTEFRQVDSIQMS